jgi:PII-like signaling protein
MKIEGKGQRLTVYVGEGDRWHGRSLFEAIILAAREAGLAGATALRGIEGFGAHSRLHTTHVLRLSEDLPVVIEIVDQADRINAFLPRLDEMIGDGLVTREEIEIIAYRAAPPPAGS